MSRQLVLRKNNQTYSCTDMPSVRGFRHVCNRKCLVEHTEHFNATHSCKKEIVKNVVHTGLEVVNKVQENLCAGNM